MTGEAHLAPLVSVARGAVAALRSPFWLGTEGLTDLLAAPRPDACRGGDWELAVKAACFALRLLARLPLRLWRNTCLYRSIAECLVLRAYGVPCRLRIGVSAGRPSHGSLDAHAWVERLEVGQPLAAPRGFVRLG